VDLAGYLYAISYTVALANDPEVTSTVSLVEINVVDSCLTGNSLVSTGVVTETPQDYNVGVTADIVVTWPTVADATSTALDSESFCGSITTTISLKLADGSLIEENVWPDTGVDWVLDTDALTLTVFAEDTDFIEYRGAIGIWLTHSMDDYPDVSLEEELFVLNVVDSCFNGNEFVVSGATPTVEAQEYILGHTTAITVALPDDVNTSYGASVESTTVCGLINPTVVV
jgi:hypothetical protein